MIMKRYLHSQVHSKTWKQPKCPSVDEWIKKMWYVHTMEYYYALKKKEILPYMTVWVNLEDIMLSGINQPQNDRYCIITFL